LTLIAILALALALAVMWRLTRFIVRLVLVGALIVVIASHLSGADPRHAAVTSPRSMPRGQRHRLPLPLVPPRPERLGDSRQARDRKTPVMIAEKTSVLTRPSARLAKAAERRILQRPGSQVLRRRERALAQIEPIDPALTEIEERVRLRQRLTGQEPICNGTVNAAAVARGAGRSRAAISNQRQEQPHAQP